MKLRTATWATAYLALCAALGGIQRCEDARAHGPDEVPPVIREIRGVVAETRRALDDARPALREPVGICEGPIALPAIFEGDDIPERAEVERVLSLCRRTGAHSDPWAVLTLVRIERDMGAPPNLLTSAACYESGFNPIARGDWHSFGAAAHGVLQLHVPFVQVCGLTRGARDDVDAAGRCYLARVLVHAEREGAECAEPWTVGEALTAHPGYVRLGCGARSAHSREREMWGAR